MTVGDLLSRLTYRELVKWQVYFSTQPFSEERADLRAGVIASTIANSRPRKRGSKDMKASDFVLKFEEEEKKQIKLSPVVLAGKLEALRHRLTKRR